MSVEGSQQTLVSGNDAPTDALTAGAADVLTERSDPVAATATADTLLMLLMLLLLPLLMLGCD